MTSEAAKTNLTRNLTARRADLERTQRILADGGFHDADGDWQSLSEAGRQRKTAEAEKLSADIAATLQKLAAL